MNIAILGSTGSVGIQTLEVIDISEHLSLYSLVANNNWELMEQQCRKYQPKVVALFDENSALKLKERISDLNIKVLSGEQGVIEASSAKDIDMVVSAIVGKAGLIPTYYAISNKKNIALANKETLVIAGHIITEMAKQNNVSIIPVDSEHSAIFQCLAGHTSGDIDKILLTASGGPFRGKSLEFLSKVTVKDALNHPNWSMGKKISVDSATLINKGLEAIEARWLFNVSLENIDVVVHPQSIIHSAIQYKDGNVIAHLSPPDMRYAIQYALNHPKRIPNNFRKLNIFEQNLTFEKPDTATFKGLSLCFEAGKKGGSWPVILNASNEECVNGFLEGSIGFTDITEIIETVLKKHSFISNPSLKEVLEIDEWARINTWELIRGKGVLS